LNILIVAPHLSYPLMDGADLYAWHPWFEMSKNLNSVTILGKNKVFLVRNGELLCTEEFENSARSKSLAALRTMVFCTNYNLEKFITPAYSKRFRRQVKVNNYDAIVFSYLSTAAALFLRSTALKGGKIYVLTHNDEVQLFADMLNSMSNPLAKRVALQSMRSAKSFAKELASQSTLVHISKRDAKAWGAHIGQHEHRVLPAGVTKMRSFAMTEVSKISRSSLIPRLLFVGSLGVKMNFDALAFFSQEFLPVLKERLPGVQLTVVGSNPDTKIIELCDLEGFELKPNLNDKDLDRSYSEAHFAILPFAYSTGTKLKLFEALSRGVPVISTTCCGSSVLDSSGFNLMSDNPNVWADHISKILKKGFSEKNSHELIASVSEYSWSSLAKNFFDREFC
jgi:glycosyltransferase involved in cell wall biosynthesis